MSKFKEILKKFQCPVCKEHVHPPIPQCQNGHVICFQCKSSRAACPVCSSSFTEKRNETLEAIANDVPFPCKYSKFGCEELNHMNSRRTHETNCRYQPFRCPYCDEEIASQPAALLHHLSKVHESKPIFQNCAEIAIKMEDIQEAQNKKPLNIHCVLEKFQEVFIFSINYNPRSKEWKFSLQMFAPKIKSEQYKGLIEMRIQNRRISYEGPIHTWQMNTNEQTINKDSLILGETYFWNSFYGGILKVDIKPNDPLVSNSKRVASWGDEF